MLLLSRKPQERIDFIVGDKIIGTIVVCSGGPVNLGFDGFLDIKIIRSELTEDYFLNPTQEPPTCPTQQK